MIEWCFTLLLTVFQSYHGDSSLYSRLSWVSSVLGWGSAVSCPRTLPRKKPKDQVRLEPRTPGLRVKHFNTEPRTTPLRINREYVHRVVCQKYLTRLGELIFFEPLARKLSFLQTELDIFDIRQYCVRILFIFQRLICLALLFPTPSNMNYEKIP